jgi:ABC-2 type transport system permease protein
VSTPSPVRQRSSIARRIATVGRREFVSTVSRTGYILTLILMPLLMLGLTLLPSIGVALSGGEEKLLGLKPPDELTVVGVVDLASPAVVDARWIDWHNEDQEAARREGREQPEWMQPALTLPPLLGGDPEAAARDRGGLEPDALLELRYFADEAAGREAVRQGEISAAFILLADYRETSRSKVLIGKRSLLNPGIYPGHRAVARLVRKSLAAPHIADPQELERLIQVMQETEEVVGLDGEPPPEATGGGEGFDETIRAIVPILFASFFAMLIFVASGYLLDGVGEEKESRILEVLLASLTPEELLLGKMLGLGAAGLLQTAFFAVVGLGPLLFFGLLGIGVGKLILMLVCGLLGFAMYASLMGASGAVAGNRHEGRQISAVFTLTAASPMFVLPAFLTGSSSVASGMSLFPLTAPIAMTLRLGVGEVPAWQVSASLVMMVVTAWLAWRVGSRVFRVAILMTGARPSLRQIWAWVRGRQGA